MPAVLAAAAYGVVTAAAVYGVVAGVRDAVTYLRSRRFARWPDLTWLPADFVLALQDWTDDGDVSALVFLWEELYGEPVDLGRSVEELSVEVGAALERYTL